MKISKRSDERPSIRVSTTYQTHSQHNARNESSFFLRLDSAPPEKAKVSAPTSLKRK